MAKKTRNQPLRPRPSKLTPVATATAVLSKDGGFTGLYDVRYSDSRQVDADRGDAFLRKLAKGGYKVVKFEPVPFVYIS